MAVCVNVRVLMSKLSHGCVCVNVRVLMSRLSHGCVC